MTKKELLKLQPLHIEVNF